jgi:hypothetical protein
MKNKSDAVLIEVAHDTETLDALAYVNVWEEDGEVMTSFVEWDVVGVTMPLDCMPFIMAEFFREVAIDEYLFWSGREGNAA